VSAAEIDWTEFNEDCIKCFGKILTGSRRHFCNDWDGLPIDDTCPEADCCMCFNGTPYERTEQEKADIQLLASGL